MTNFLPGLPPFFSLETWTDRTSWTGSPLFYFFVPPPAHNSLTFLQRGVLFTVWAASCCLTRLRKKHLKRISSSVHVAGIQLHSWLSEHLIELIAVEINPGLVTSGWGGWIPILSWCFFLNSKTTEYSELSPSRDAADVLKSASDSKCTITAEERKMTTLTWGHPSLSNRTTQHLRPCSWPSSES